MGRSKLTTLKATTLKTFFQLCSQLGITDQYNYNQQNNTIFWNNGSEILLKDLFLYPSDPEFDSLGSLEITGAFIDECNQVVYKAWQVVKSRIRYRLLDWDISGKETKDMDVVERNEHNKPVAWIDSIGDITRGLEPKLLGTCNPAKNWVYKEFYRKDKDNSIREDRKFIQALPTDNHHLPESYLKSLLELDKNSKQRLYYGNWEYDDDPSTLISYDAICDYWNGPHMEVNVQDERFLTIDVARKGRDKTVFRVWHGWVCTKRISIAISLINEIVDKARELQKQYGIPNSMTIADEDGVGGGVVDYLSNGASRCEGFVNNSKALNGENYENLKSQCSILMAKKIQRREAIELCEERQVIDLVSEEMEQVKIKDIDKDTKLGIVPKDKTKEMLGRSPDDWDSIMMRYYFELVETSFVFG